MGLVATLSMNELAESVNRTKVLDISRRRWLAAVFRWRPWQFILILPNQVLFWMVIVVGFTGSVDPELNFATVITWKIWFCLLFVLTLITGRGWCVVCPFGGLAEWIQRRTLWGRSRTVGSGKAMPEWITRYGYLTPVTALILLTWIEVYYSIAGTAAPWKTSCLVLAIIAVAVTAFLTYERRGFCRYLCPLSGLIGILGAVAPLGGFRARDRAICHKCDTKTCLRGSASTETNGCPWYAWPGTAETNLTCGLCAECHIACPKDNVGLVVTPPLRSIIDPGQRRADVAWGVALLAGLITFENVDTTDTYIAVERWADTLADLPTSPNPLTYLGLIVAVVLLAAIPALLLSWVLLPRTFQLPQRGTSFVYRSSRFRAVFLPLMYAGIPLLAADYLGHQIPGFARHALSVVPSFFRMLSSNTTVAASLDDAQILGDDQIAATQIIIIGIGVLASLTSAWRIAGRETALTARSETLARAGLTIVMAGYAALVCAIYLMIRIGK